MDEEETVDREISRPAVTTEASFHEALRALVREADSNGVDVRGGWPLVQGDHDRHWDVEVTSVVRPTTARVDDAGSAATSVVAAVAAREDVETTDLPPLQDTIDRDILESLCRTNSDDRHIQFHYYGYEITVRSDGSIRLEG